MATGYTRQSAGSIVTGNTIQASDFNNEYNQLAAAFDAISGHTHDGTVGGGAPVGTSGVKGLTNTSAGIVTASGSNSFGIVSLFGTAAQLGITSTAGALTFYIDPGYVGQSSITTVGTITSGTWQSGLAATGGTINSTQIGNASPAQGTFSALYSIVSSGNGLSMIGTAAGNSSASITAYGTDTNINFVHSTKGIGSHIFTNNTGNNVVASITGGASCVNYPTISAATTGNNISISASGSDTNIGITYIAKGAVGHTWYSNSAAVLVAYNNLTSVSNYFTMVGGPSGQAPALYASGSDANIDINIVPAGAGLLRVQTGPLTSDNTNAVATTSFVKSNLGSYAPLNSPNLIGAPTAPNAGFGDNSTAIATTHFVSQAMPCGSVVAFAGPGAPAGWLECAGYQLSRTTYSLLFGTIGTYWGAGDGSTTFNIPDLRGMFLRGYDNGRGIDSGRGFGTYQGSDNLSHGHATAVGDPGHNHTAASGQGASGTGANQPTGANVNANSGVITVSTSGTGVSVGIYPSGGSESRPQNMSIMYIIKIQ